MIKNSQPLVSWLLAMLGLVLFIPTTCFSQPESIDDQRQPRSESSLLSTETVTGSAWVSAATGNARKRSGRFVVKVWFDEQFLGDGEAYLRRAKEFSKATRRNLRLQVVATLKHTSDKSYAKAKPDLQKLLDDQTITGLERHWIVNGFTCTTDSNGVKALQQVPGVKKIFITNGRPRQNPRSEKRSAPKALPPIKDVVPFDPEQYQHPWYIEALKANRVWKELGVNGKGTLNVVHDFNFVYPAHLSSNAYRNPHEIPGNRKDDDGNGWVDDCFGFNFANDSSLLTTNPNPQTASDLHGTMCATIICGTGTKNSPHEFGIAPGGKWAGLIAAGNIESAVEWAIEQKADTYSMSFSRPNLGELRSHWRKLMEHGSFCGIYFVSGAGNFATTAKVPVQMRTPEDIPNVVFAAAGVHRDLSRTAFSSKGPVEWKTEHYKDGRVQKPEVCAFNHRLPLLLPDGTVRPNAINGNSFAGPMFCGSIALMLSADPDLLPWDLREIITSTATDVGPEGVDDETGHGLINCYDAVKEVLRRKAIRDSAELPLP